MPFIRNNIKKLDQWLDVQYSLVILKNSYSLFFQTALVNIDTNCICLKLKTNIEWIKVTAFVCTYLKKSNFFKCLKSFYFWLCIAKQISMTTHTHTHAHTHARTHARTHTHINDENLIKGRQNNEKEKCRNG